MSLLKSMLKIDPEKRPSAKECISHSYFQTKETNLPALNIGRLSKYKKAKSKRFTKSMEKTTM